MNITAALAAVAPRGSKYAVSIEAAAKAFGINTPLRQAHWLAQMAHESMGFKYVREIWGPTEAQVRYEGRRDLGNTEPGDGRRYAGKGFIQLTGRANYTQASQDIYGDDRLVKNPELVEQDPALSAGWYWSKRRINRHADTDDIVSVTLAINGGKNGLADRKEWLRKFKEAML